uniref:RNA-directed RNA polymerase L n=1 Tax=Mammalian orthorubulavirus 5 TaxID=2560580 RepID=A0A4V1DVV3_9MONO|nr:L protein [parainfluenza virus 5]
MAGSREILLPEVHLNSPIVKHKLYYYILLGNLPNEIDIDDLGPLHIQNWNQIAHEESNLAQRLVNVRNFLITHIPDLRKGHWQEYVNVILWPRILPLIPDFKINDQLPLLKNWDKLVKESCSVINAGTSQCIQNLSYGLTGRGNLFTRSRELSGDRRDIDLKTVVAAWHDSDWKRISDFWIMIKFQMRQLIVRQTDHNDPDLITYIENREGIIIITPELVALFNTENHTLTYMTFEIVLMVSDMYEGRHNILSLCTVSTYLNPLKKRIKYLLSLVDNLAFQIGDAVYNIIALLESFVYAQLQMSDPIPELRGQFHAFVCSEILDALRGTNSFTQDELRTVTTNLISPFHDLTPDLTAELLCIMRLWGHPMLTASQAAGKVRESMCAGKVLDFPTIMKTLAFFHTILINGYRRKHHGVWPPLNLPGNASKGLTELMNDNTEISYEFTLKHWKKISLIKFKKCFDADAGEELSIFMKDKAISAPKQDWMSVFRRSLIKQRHQHHQVPLPNPFNRRLLLNFLGDDKFDPNVELQYVTSGEYLHDDTFCASYSLKEKEIKPDGRIFAKLTKRMRSCQVIAESLLANHAGKLMKENGVVMNQLSLTKSLLTMSQIGIISEKARKSTRDNINQPGFQNIQRNKSHHSKQVNQRDPSDDFELAASFLTTDLKKYCLQWRYQTIIPFAQSLNRMYGYPHLFEWIHLRLMRSTLYVGDPFNPPADTSQFDLDKVINGDIFIVSPRGGIEGLCQKAWTMISISVIILSATESGTRVMSMVQGDNQAIAVTIRVPRSLPTLEKKTIAFRSCNLFFERLKCNNFGLGHHLKEQETIISSHFFVYSKRIFYQGRILTQALKNASKLCLTADVLGECTQSSCSNLATTVMRLTENGVEKDICFYLNIYMTIKQLSYDIIFPQVSIPGDQITLEYINNPHLVSRLALLPSQLGGLNYLSCSRLFNRNIGDPVVSAVADLKRLIKSGCMDYWILYNLLGRKPGNGSWATLAADPYSINIEYQYPPTTALKRHTQQALMELSTNPMLRGIFSDNAQAEENNLARFLLDREVIFPRVAHIIIEQTSVGRRKQIQGYLDSTRSIMRKSLEIKPLSNRKLNEILDYNINYLAYNLALLKNAIEPPTYLKAMTLETCSIDIARSLRKLSWAPLLGGRNLEGLETPDPIEITAGALIVGSGYCEQCAAGDNRFTWFFLPSGIEIGGDPRDNPPIRVPYIGSRTDERRVASMAYIRGASSSLKAVLRLAGVYIWAFGDTLENWIDALDLSHTRVNITLEQLQSLTPLPTSANLTHRLDDGTTTLKFTPASSYTFSSFTHISNDEQYLTINDKTADSNIIYQQLMITGLGILETWNNPPINRTFEESTLHLHTGASCCVRPVDSCIISEALTVKPHITVPYSNKFVFDEDPLSEYETAKLESLSFQAQLCNIDAVDMTGKLTLLSQFTARQIINAITGLDESVSLTNDAIVASDYVSNWISECMYTKLDELFMYCGWEILLELSYQMYYLRVVGWSNIVDYSYMILRRIPGAALNNLASTLSHPKLFRRAINLDIVAPLNAPHFASLDYIKMSVDAILWGCKRVINVLSNGGDLELVVTSEDSLILSDRSMNLIARKLTLLSLIHHNGLELPKIKGFSPDEKCFALTEFLRKVVNSGLSSIENLSNFMYNVENPRLAAFASNNYYLTRKLLNSIRDTESGQVAVTSYYESLEYIDSLKLTPHVPGTSCIEDDSLCTNDYIIWIIESNANLEKYPIPNSPEDDSKFHNFKLNAPSHHTLRPLGLSSTAWYKGISCCRYLERLKPPQGDHLYIAEGSGASMTIIEYLFPGRKIYYNSLFSSGDNPPQRNYAPMPTQFIESVPYKLWQAHTDQYPEIFEDFIPLWNGNAAMTDIGMTACVEFIINRVGPRTCSLVHVDLESSASLNQQCLSKPIINAIITATTVLCPHGVLILKYSWLPFTRFSTLITFLWCYFERITVLRSTYSGPANHEVYLICILANNFAFQTVSQATGMAMTLTDQGFTLISPERINQYWDGHLKQERIVAEAIDKVVLGENALFNSSDNELILKCGGTPNARNLIDIEPVATFIEFEQLICTMLTTHLKEIIDITRSGTQDYESLLLTPYNLGLLGKISTIVRLLTERILNHTIRNWLILPPSLRMIVKQDLEFGIFRITSILNSDRFLRLSPNRKYLIIQLTAGYIKKLIEGDCNIDLTRPIQKQIWKALGCVVYCHDPMDQRESTEFIDININEEIDRGIDGEEI